MKLGSDLTALATKLTEQRENAQDFLVKEEMLRMRPEAGGDGTVLMLPDESGVFTPRDLTHGQIAAHLKIPKPYYDRMRREAPELLSSNVNQWLQDSTDGTRLIRTVGPEARAFLSDRYRPLDNYDLAEAVLPTLIEAGTKVKSCDLTETHMYIKAFSEEKTFEVKKGDVVELGVSIRNSDVGCSSLEVAPILNRLVCLNGMKVNEMATRRRHVGRRNNGFEEGELVREFLTDEAREADDRALWLKLRDTVAASLSEAVMPQIRQQLLTAAEVDIQKPAVEVVENLGKTFTLNEGETASVLDHLIKGGDMTQWGLANAVTSLANDVDDYDRASELEEIGWNVVRLERTAFAA